MQFWFFGVCGETLKMQLRSSKSSTGCPYLVKTKVWYQFPYCINPNKAGLSEGSFFFFFFCFYFFFFFFGGGGADVMVMLRNPKNRGKMMKTANIDKEFLHILWTTWGNSMKLSVKMCFRLILKVTKNEGFTLSLKDTFFQKTTGWRGVNLTPLPAVLGSIGVFRTLSNIYDQNVKNLYLSYLTRFRIRLIMH